MISNRYAQANNKYTEDGLDTTVPTSFIAYLDADNHYGHAMSQPLPTGKFRFLSEHDIDNLDILNVADDNPTGYIVEIDLEYLPELYELHNYYPLAPESVLITRDMLCYHRMQNLSRTDTFWTKNCSEFTRQKQYVTHYVNLKLYVRLGMRVKRIHRILEFAQSMD